jgi:hypothetical protein
MNSLLEFALVFGVTAIVDAVWAIYLGAVAEKKAFKSAAWGSMIVALGAVSFFAYIHNPIMVAAAVMGGFVGTYITVKRSK